MKNKETLEIVSGDEFALALPETDAISISLRPAAKNNLNRQISNLMGDVGTRKKGYSVTVLKERAGFSIGELYGSLSIPRSLNHGTKLAILGVSDM